MPPILFGEWKPDSPDPGDAAREALNVIPEKEGYRPFKGLATTTSTLDARAQGASWFRAPDGTTKNFAGDVGKLYLQVGSTWTNVSRAAGGPYTTDGTGNWRFAQFKGLAYATNGVDVPQSFDLNSATNWSAATGSPPPAKFIGVVRNFLVLANVSGSPQLVKWSGDNNSSTWTPSATTLSDEQDQPDGGEITGFQGGEFGLVGQESALRRMTFEGSPTVFRFDKIAEDFGNTIPNAMAGWGNLCFICHRSGFHMIVGGQQITPIGKNRFDRWFWGLLDQSNMHRVTSAIDPVNSLYIVSFPVGSSGQASGLLIYNWKADRAAHAVASCEMIYSGATQQTWTLEDLDVFGSIEQVPFSLDSSYWTGSRQLLLAGFSNDHKSGTFSGANLKATLDAGEMQPIPGRRARLLGARPLIDGGTPTIAVGTRRTQQSPVTWSSPKSMIGQGINAVAVTAPLADGEVLAGNTGAAPTGQTIETLLQAKPGVSFETIALLKAYQGPATGVLVTQDGRGGEFAWRSGDQSANVTADPREGVWVAPDSDPTGTSGAWQRFYKDVVLAEWFGAQGDDAADDTAALQAAVDASVLLSAKLILLEKNYKTTDSLNVTEHFTTIEGSGAASVIKIYSTTADAIHVPNGVGEFAFRNFAIDRGSVPVSGAGIFTGHASWGVIDRITAYNHWHGLNLGAAAFAQARHFITKFNYSHGVNLRSSASDPAYRAQQWGLSDFLSELNNGWGVYHLSESNNNTMGTFSQPATYANGLGGIGIFGQSGCSINDLVIVSAICSTNGNDGIRIDPWGGGNNCINGAFCELSGTESTGRSKGGAGELPTSNQGCGVRICAGGSGGWVQLTDIITMINSEEGFRFDADLTILVGANLQSKGNAYNLVSNRYGVNCASSATKYIFSNIVSGGFDIYTQAYGLRAANASNATITGGNLQANATAAALASSGSFMMVGVQGAAGGIEGKTLLLQEDAVSTMLNAVQFNASLQATIGLQHASAGADFFIKRFSNGAVWYHQIGNYPHQFLVNNALKMEVGDNITFVGLPTSPAGLTSGQLWRDTGAGDVVKVVP